LFHISWLARYPRPQFLVFDNEIMGKLKREFKQICGITIMALKPNQLQVTTNISQANCLLTLFDLENRNNHENIEEQEDNRFDDFLQSVAWLPGY
jgi:hypothetical protein